MGVFCAGALIAALFAAPVQITVNPCAVRVDTAAHIGITWTRPMPQNATLQWKTTSGGVYGDGAGGFEYTAPAVPGRAFIHLSVITDKGVWAECAVPVQVYRQFVVLKADDFGIAPPDSLQRFWDYVDALKSRGIKTSLGMMAVQCQNPTAEVRDRIMGLARGGFVEFWNHGYDHALYLPDGTKGALHDTPAVDDLVEKAYPDGTAYEFQGRAYEEQLDHLVRAQKAILDTYGIALRAFGAPFNKTDANTAKALRDLGQIHTWIYGTPPERGVHILPRGGGDIESQPGTPSLRTFLATHDRTSPLLVLQHHPGFAVFRENWGQFTAILEQIRRDCGTFILPDEYVRLFSDGTLPLEPAMAFPDAALECALRTAVGQWDGTPVDPAALAKLTSLQWADRTPQIRSLAGIGACGALRQIDLSGNAITDATPLLDLWRATGGELSVQLQNNPAGNAFTCDELARLDDQGLHIDAGGGCDNVVLTLTVEGNGRLDPAGGVYILPRGSAVTVHANSGKGWKFDRWEGVPDAKTLGDIDVILTTHQHITAKFAALPKRVPAGGIISMAVLAMTLAWTGAARRSAHAAHPSAATAAANTHEKP